MIPLIDTHCHPTLIIEREKTKHNNIISHDEIIQEAENKGVQKIFCISTNPKEFISLQKLAQKYDAYYFSLGIHPTDVDDLSDKDLENLEQNIIQAQKESGKLIAIGEIGIDLYHINEAKNTEKQIYFFKKQLDLAKKYNLPVIIHTRSASELTYKVLLTYDCHKKGVIHAFQENKEYAKKYTDLGFLLGIGGIVTYPANTYLRDIVSSISLQSLLLETDAPFLPPQNMRGQINYPYTITDIAAYITRLREENKEEILRAFYDNTTRLFF